MSPERPDALLALDLDGTVIDAGATGRSSALLALVEKLSTIAMEVVPTTARPATEVAALFEPVSAIRRAICANGACAVELRNGRAVSLLRERVLEPGTVRVFLRFAASQPAWAFLFRGWHAGFHMDCVVRGERALDEIVHTTLARARAIRDLPLAIANQAVEHVIAAGLLIPSEQQGTLFRQMAHSLEGSAATIIQYPETAAPGWSWIECVPEPEGKAASMRAIEPRWARATIWRVAAGDGESDAALLRDADVGICPADATNAARASADTVSPAAGGEAFACWLGDWLVQRHEMVRGAAL